VSFRDILAKTLLNYHNRLIGAAAVIQSMIQIRQDLEANDRRAAEFGLNEEGLAFYDAVAEGYNEIYGQEFLRALVPDVVQSIRRNLKVEWTAPHREDVKAEVRAAVKRVLRQRKVKREDFDVFLTHIMSQAEALYAEYLMAA
jgi:type I restriction enzyme R subunit